MIITFFIDANVLLHYKHFKEVNWLSFSSDKSVTEIQIRLASSVVDELDNLKYTHPSKKMRHRIADILACIDESLEQNDGMIQDNVSLCFDSGELDPNAYTKFALSKESGDDRLLASILRHSNENLEIVSWLITNDIGLKHKARLRNIKVIKMPAELKLPDEPDTRDRQIHELKQMVEKHAVRMPDLKLEFSNFQEWAEVTLSQAPTLTGLEVAQKMEAIRKAFPKQEESDVPDYVKKHAGLLIKPDVDLKQMNLVQVIGAAVSEFYKSSLVIANMKTESFYKEYKLYLAAESQYLAEMARTIQLGLVLLNRGTIPADDVDIQIKFPLGLQVGPREGLPPRPAPPVSPNQTSILPPEVFPPAQVASATKLSFRKVFDGTIVEGNIPRLKHLLSAALPLLYVKFDSEDTIRSFTMPYILHASNVSSRITGELNLKVSRSGRRRRALRTVNRRRTRAAKQ
jgi:PIN domain